MKTDFYVYALFRTDTGLPFYIGKGRANRWLIHQKRYVPGRNYKDCIISVCMDATGDVPKVKLCQGLDEATALRYEKAWIAALGRYPEGMLANGTDGGDGVTGLTKDRQALQIAHMKKLWADPEWRARQMKKLLAVDRRAKDPVVLATRNARISAALLGKKRPAFSEEWRANIGAAAKGRVKSLEERAKLSAFHKGRPKDPAHIARLADQKRGVPLSEQHKARLREAHAKRRQNKAAEQQDGGLL